MTRPLPRVAVIGAGVMGAGIAAHCANAGCAVILLDLPADGPDRARFARDAVARQVKAGGFMHPTLAQQVRVGDSDADLAWVADCDWVIEAVIEDLAVKRALYARLDAVMKPDAVLSSNTSTIPLAQLTAGLPAARAARFVVTHFFNPPRHMRLLELVSPPEVAPAARAWISDVADRVLGKSVVTCKDTPGFLANRIGCYWMLAATHYAVALGLTVEEADAVIGRPFGIPSTGIFGLTDLVGIDLMPKVWRSFAETLPVGDGFHALYAPLAPIDGLIAQGAVGRKAGRGFYRRGPNGMEAVDLATLTPRPLRPAQLDSLAAASPAALLAHPDKGGRYAWAVMSATLSYAAGLVPEISDSVPPIDEAMRLGYNWRWGPFELIDRIGPQVLIDGLTAEGRPVPPLLRAAAAAKGFYADGPTGPTALTLTPTGAGAYAPTPRAPGLIFAADFRRAGKPVAGNAAASLWDMGDGVACLEFHRKLNALAPDSLDAIEQALAATQRDFRALVIGNDAAAFCAGADLSLFLAALERGDRPFIDAFIRRGQSVFAAIQQAAFPVVGAVAGLALGGGCEILLHCHAVQAHAETQMGLVERNVGLIPAWGGCLASLTRAVDDKSLPRGPLPAAKAAFEIIAGAATSTSARHARDLRFLRAEDGITMNRDRLLADAKARALGLALDLAAAERPAWVAREFRLPGPSGAATLVNWAESMVPLGLLTGFDLEIARVLAGVLTGGADGDPTRPVSASRLLDLEREGFLALTQAPACAQRIAHMLKTGKPLRN